MLLHACNLESGHMLYARSKPKVQHQQRSGKASQGLAQRRALVTNRHILGRRKPWSKPASTHMPPRPAPQKLPIAAHFTGPAGMLEELSPAAPGSCRWKLACCQGAPAQHSCRQRSTRPSDTGPAS